MTVDSGYAQTLKGDASYKVYEDAAIKAAWGELAIDTEIITSLALAADADVEGPRQLDFLKGPNVKDAAVVTGWRSDLIGKVIIGKNPKLGYDGAGKSCFVVGATENRNGTTTLLVIRRL